MTTKTKQRAAHPKQHPSSQGRKKSRGRKPSFGWTWGPWIVIGAIVILALAIWKTGSKPAGGVVASPEAATPFTLPATDGSQVSLADFKGENVLLYFSEGVGCDACFYQMTSLEQDSGILQDAGISKVIPLVVNPIPDVQQAVAQNGIKTPFLVDADMSVSNSYDMIGTGMHADLPGHGFVLIDGSGQVRWTMNYPSMFASAKQIVNDIGGALQ